MNGESLCLLFHGIREESEETPYHPELFVTRNEIEDLIARLKVSGYSFRFPWDAGGRGSISITFDDGYFNNSRMLPIAEKHGIPLILFVASHNIERQQPFIWDVWDAAGSGPWPLTKADYSELYSSLETGALADAARKLMASDLYRPFRVEELRAFAESPWVRLAPHGDTHQPLVGPYRIRLEKEIQKSRDFLKSFGSSYVDEFSFPCGLYDRSTLKTLQKKFRRVYTIDGGSMNPTAAIVSRISLVSPSVGGPLHEQIDRWLGWKSRLVRQAVNIRYSHPLLSQI